MKKIKQLFILLAMFAALFLYCPLVLAVESNLSAPISVVVVSGSNYEMGVQYGEQAAGLIAENRAAAWELLKPLGLEMVKKDIKVWTYYIEKYNPMLVQWLNGISDGCSNKGVEVSYGDLITLMVLPQEIWSRPSDAYPEETGVLPAESSLTEASKQKIRTHLAQGRTDTRAMASCTAFAATGTATGGDPMVSLTLGYIPEITKYVILFAYPSDGEEFVSLTMAGKVSNNTGMNKHFAWAMTAAVTHPLTDCASSWGVTSEAYHHYIQQYCTSPEEAIAFLNSTPTGGVTGIFLFADKSGKTFAYEVGACESAARYPGDLDEPTDFVASANNYNSKTMAPYAIPADLFGDTYIRYATIFKKLSEAGTGGIDLDFAKQFWLSNDWYDEAEGKWKSVPIPNDPDDLNTCNVPGNNCEGGESQVIQFPKQKTAYLQSGGPHGTAIQYYWPENPKPTGEYTKWRLAGTIDETARAASRDTLRMLKKASRSFRHQKSDLSPGDKAECEALLGDAWEAWDRAEQSISSPRGRNHKWKRHSQGYARRTDRFKAGKNRLQTIEMADWGAAYTDYATAQLYSQMVSTKLVRLSAD